MVLAFAPRFVFGPRCSQLRIREPLRSCPIVMTGASHAMSARTGVETSAVVTAPVSLDRSLFGQKWRVFALCVPPKLCQGIILALKDHVLRVPRVAAVAKSADPHQMRIVLLRYFAEQPPDFEFAPRGNMDPNIVGDAETVAARISSSSLIGKSSDDVTALVRAVKAEKIVERSVELEYEHWSAEAVLNRLLPKSVTVYVCAAAQSPTLSCYFFLNTFVEISDLYSLTRPLDLVT
jgi:hypothetical protein